MAYIQFLGAAGVVTGSKHLINTGSDSRGKDGFQLLIDCGLFQGPKQWRERNWQDMPVPAKEIDAVVLTHAHLDHSGWIPRLVREGFGGQTYATRPTIDLCSILLPDSGHLQEEDAEFHNKHKSSKHTPALPLYTSHEAQASLQYFKPVELDESKQLCPQLSFRCVRAAHILGSCMVEVTLRTDGDSWKLLFTGDLGRVPNQSVTPGKVVHSGPTEGETADLLVMESTYGNRRHPSADPGPQLASIIKETVERGGTVIVPAFAVERTQKFLFMLKELMETGQIPRLPVYCDSPMAIKAIEVFLTYTDEYSDDTRNLIRRCGSPLEWSGFTFAATPQESRKINADYSPCIIISASGMATGGRILHHLAQRMPDARNTILFIGFQAPGTRGHAIKNGARSSKIFGQQIPVRAKVVALEQFSDHADPPEMLAWLDTFKNKPGRTYLVHGEPAASSLLRDMINKELAWKVEIAEWMQKVELS